MAKDSDLLNQLQNAAYFEGLEILGRTLDPPTNIED